MTESSAVLLDPLSERYDLSREAVHRLGALLDILAADDTAPTTVRDPKEAVDAHVADSLVAVELLEVRTAATIADIGAGAGFPGLPLAVALPSARLVLVESARRKCQFLERAAAAAAPENVEIVNARVEEWCAGHARCDVVVVRAVDSLPVLVEYAAPLLRVGGRLVAWKGRRDAAEEAAGAGAAPQVGLQAVSVVPVTPFPAAQHRHLHVYSKVSPTPERFPRRPGMARKRPLS